MRRHIDTLNMEKKNSRLLIHKSYLITDVKLIYHFFLALSKIRELKEKLKKVIGFLVWDNLVFNSLKARHLEATSTTFTHAQTFDLCVGLIWDLFIWSSLSWPTFRP